MVKIIRNFLPEEQAKQLASEIYETPDNWWSYAYKWNKVQNPIYLSNTLKDKYIKNNIESDLIKSFTGGDFTYKFKRSTKHFDTCTCASCSFKKSFLEQTMLETIKNHTNLKDPYLFESFVSVYDKGDFLNLHTDENRGVAFILNLTEGWKPEYGGMLNIVKNETEFTAIFPEFNSLVLLELGEEGVPHFVSEISKYAPLSRIAISGWYNEN